VVRALQLIIERSTNAARAARARDVAAAAAAMAVAFGTPAAAAAAAAAGGVGASGSGGGSKRASGSGRGGARGKGGGAAIGAGGKGEKQAASVAAPEAAVAQVVVEERDPRLDAAAARAVLEVKLLGCISSWGLALVWRLWLACSHARIAYIAFLLRNPCIA